MEAEADLVNYGTSPSLREELEGLGMDEDIERELEALKSSRIPEEREPETV